MASSTTPITSVADASVRASSDASRLVVEVVVPILHDTLAECIEAANARIDERLVALTLDSIPGLAEAFAAQQQSVINAQSDAFVYALLF